MRIRRTAISAAFVAGLATLPLSAAEAQYYPLPPARRFRCSGRSVWLVRCSVLPR
jgi:hypothetical protein